MGVHRAVACGFQRVIACRIGQGWIARNVVRQIFVHCTIVHDSQPTSLLYGRLGAWCETGIKGRLCSLSLNVQGDAHDVMRFRTRWRDPAMKRDRFASDLIGVTINKQANVDQPTSGLWSRYCDCSALEIRRCPFRQAFECISNRYRAASAMEW